MTDNILQYDDDGNLILFDVHLITHRGNSREYTECWKVEQLEDGWAIQQDAFTFTFWPHWAIEEMECTAQPVPSSEELN